MVGLVDSNEAAKPGESTTQEPRKQRVCCDIHIGPRHIQTEQMQIMKLLESKQQQDLRRVVQMP
jgi:hypothetical protein